jgi:hypothetical protein
MDVGLTIFFAIKREIQRLKRKSVRLTLKERYVLVRRNSSVSIPKRFVVRAADELRRAGLMVISWECESDEQDPHTFNRACYWLGKRWVSFLS